MLGRYQSRRGRRLVEVRHGTVLFMIAGHVHPAFRGVADAFEREALSGASAGASLTVHHRGAVVVDVWGGRRSATDPWRSDTMATSFSTSKGIVSTLLHLLADRGAVDYREPVATYWPEFGQAGKHRISIRTLASHEAGLYDVRSLVPEAALLNDWQAMLRLLEGAEPIHRPGSRHGYHAWTYGYLVGGLIERVTGKRLADVLQDELAGPLGLDGAYFGVPASELDRVADLVLPNQSDVAPPTRRRLGVELTQKVASAALRSQTRESRKALFPHGMRDFDLNGPDFRSASNPSAGGVFTARSLARVYAVLSEGGTLDGHHYVSPHTLATMATRQSSGPDAVLRLPMQWRLGYHRVFSLALPLTLSATSGTAARARGPIRPDACPSASRATAAQARRWATSAS